MPARSPKPVTDWTPPVSDDALHAKTGRRWAEWISALDAAGCATMQHGAIVKVVTDKFEVGPWWRQTVAVGYERARGLRQVNETPQGFGASASRTVNAGVDALWRAWTDAALRERWLPEKMAVRGATPSKSVRLTWHDGSDVQAWFTDKGSNKSSVSVDHRKLQQQAIGPTKAFWKERLAALKSLLEDAEPS